jgi:hypothetical protein
VQFMRNFYDVFPEFKYVDVRSRFLLTCSLTGRPNQAVGSHQYAGITALGLHVLLRPDGPFPCISGNALEGPASSLVACIQPSFSDRGCPTHHNEYNPFPRYAQGISMACVPANLCRADRIERSASYSSLFLVLLFCQLKMCIDLHRRRELRWAIYSLYRCVPLLPLLAVAPVFP